MKNAIKRCKIVEKYDIVEKEMKDFKKSPKIIYSEKNESN
jgi:hypothetical protein